MVVADPDGNELYFPNAKSLTDVEGGEDRSPGGRAEGRTDGPTNCVADDAEDLHAARGELERWKPGQL